MTEQFKLAEIEKFEFQIQTIRNSPNNDDSIYLIDSHCEIKNLTVRKNSKNKIISEENSWENIIHLK